MRYFKKERGQVLILIILAIVAIFGFAALAVDGGRVFAERRRAQNAADAAALAAAFAGTQMGNWADAGIQSTQKNGYDDTDPGAVADLSTVDEDVQIHHPPATGRYKGLDDYYQVIIYKKVDQVFSQFVFTGKIAFTVEAVVRGTGGGGFPSGAALVATCPNCCDGVFFSGNGVVEVDGGDIISNSIRDGGNSGSCHSLNRSNNACVHVKHGDISAGGSLRGKEGKCKESDVGMVADNIEEKTNYSWNYSWPYTPVCPANTVTKNGYNKSETLDPGTYTNGIKVSGKNTVITLNPGLYCLEGDLDVSSGTIRGDGVMFYVKNNSSISITTSDQGVALTAPNKDTPPIIGAVEKPDYRWTGFLVFMPEEQRGTIHFAGGGTTTYTGTVYAPGPPGPGNPDVIKKCTFNGNGIELGLNASIICYSVDIMGDGKVSIVYNDDTGAQSPAMLEVTE